MFYAIIENQNGERTGKLYTSQSEFIKDTFNPFFKPVFQLNFKVTGKTYQEKKESVRNIAAEWSTNVTTVDDLSWLECMAIANWFWKQGGRFGLLKEFQENAIC